MVVNGEATIGTATISSNTSSEGDDNSKMLVNGAVRLNGDLSAPHLDLNLNPTAMLDLNGHSARLLGSYSRWKGGSQVLDSSAGGGGTVHVTDQGNLLVDGAVTVGMGATVSLARVSNLPDPNLTDGTLFNLAPGGARGGPGVLKGQGRLRWTGGSFSNLSPTDGGREPPQASVILAPGFHTVMDGGGTRVVDATARLVNQGLIEVDDGNLQVSAPPGLIDNQAGGVLAACPGATLSSNNGGDPRFMLVNDAGATLSVKDHSTCPGAPASTTVKADLLNLLNNGDIHIPPAHTLLNTGSAGTLHDGGTLSGGGTLRIGDGAQLGVIGTTTLSDGSVLALDGSGARLEAGQMTGQLQQGGVLSALASAGGGTLRWHQGTIGGNLLTDRDLLTDVTAGGGFGARSFDVPGSSGGTTSLITLASPTHFTAASAVVDSGVQVVINGATTLSGADAGLQSGGSGLTPLSIGATGSVSATGAGTSGLIDLPFTNTGVVAVDAATLRIPGGYGQTGSGATVLRDGATLSTDDGQGNRQTVALNAGSFGGSGTLVGSLDAAGGTVRPSPDGSTPGQLSIMGDYNQHAGAALHLLLAGTQRAQHDALAVTGTATLGGHLVADTDPRFQPAVSTLITNAITAGAYSASFADVSSTGEPAGTAWGLQGPFGGVFDLVLGSAPGAAATSSTASAPANPATGTTASAPASTATGPQSTVTAEAMAFSGAVLETPNVAVSAGVATVRVACPPATPGGCNEQLTLTSTPGAGAAKARHKPHVLTLAAARAHIAAGTTATIWLRLTPAASRQLRHRHTIYATLTLVSTDGAHARTSGRTRLTLRLKESRKR